MKYKIKIKLEVEADGEKEAINKLIEKIEQEGIYTGFIDIEPTPPPSGV